MIESKANSTNIVMVNFVEAVLCLLFLVYKINVNLYFNMTVIYEECNLSFLPILQGS